MSEPANTNIQGAISDTINQFSSAADVNTSDSGFLNSNGVIAKVVFLIMVIIVFVLLFYVVVRLIGYFTATPQNPLLVPGQIQGTASSTISQNPSDKSAKTLLRSNNQNNGIEFTWSVWLAYTGSGSNANGVVSYQPVFVKGDMSTTGSTFCSLNNGPGVYFSVSDTLYLYILMDTVGTPASQEPLDGTSPNIIILPNIPAQGQYFHLAVRCEGTIIDIYINGNIVRSQDLLNVPKQNFYNVQVCPNGGFPGLLSNLQYFSKALSVIDINSIVNSGPNTASANQPVYTPDQLNAISSSWYSRFIQ
jgi:hypothetical protein